MSEVERSDGDQQQEPEVLNLEDVVDVITHGVKKVLISFGVVFGGSAILGRILSQHIWAAPEFFGVLGLGALILLLGCLERLMLLRSKNGNVVMAVDAVNLLLETYPSLLQRPSEPGDAGKKPGGSLETA
jgi:hypothetical protein